MKGAFVIALLVSVAAAAKVTFDGHQVLRLTIGDDAQLRVLNELLTESQAGASDLDWWDEPTHVGDFTDIRVAPAAKQSMALFISSHGIESRVMIEDLQALIDQQAAQKAAQPKSADWFSDYHSYDDGVKWLTDLVAQYSHIASMKVIGQSYEKNNIHAIEITGAGGANVTKPAIFLDAGMHAREWISMATVQYIVNQLLTKYDSDQEVKKYVDSIRWTIVPFYNPDGYKYTWSTDRMWRKSRTPNAGSSCAGTDPNRNLPIGFGGASTSTNPCSDVYYGKNPKDEPCVKVVTDALEATDNLMAYINFHSYSQTFLSPYDYTTTKPPEPDFTNQATMRKAYVAAIKKSTGVTYSEQLGCDLYPSGGGMPDYVYVDLGVVFSFTCELRDTGTYGFLLPASQISPTGQENFAGVKALAAAVLA